MHFVDGEFRPTNISLEIFLDKKIVERLQTSVLFLIFLSFFVLKEEGEQSSI